MEVHPHKVFYLFKLDFEKHYGCINVSNLQLENPNSLDSDIATQLFKLFKTLCHQSIEITIEDSLEIEDLIQEDYNESEESFSQEFNSQVSFTDSSESPSASQSDPAPTKKKKLMPMAMTLILKWKLLVKVINFHLNL